LAVAEIDRNYKAAIGTPRGARWCNYFGGEGKKRGEKRFGVDKTVAVI